MEDYKERMIKEYSEVKERYNKLHKMIIKYEAGTLDFTPNCSVELLKAQAKAMGEYLHILEIRSEIEKIGLDNLKDEKITTTTTGRGNVVYNTNTRSGTYTIV